MTAFKRINIEQNLATSGDIVHAWNAILENYTQKISSGVVQMWKEYLTPASIDVKHGIANFTVINHVYQEEFSKDAALIASAFELGFKRSFRVNIDIAAEVVQLPLWPIDDRIAPNEFLRSALFGVVQRGRRRRYDNEIIESWRNVELRYTGEALDQSDLDVWLQAVQLLRDKEFGKPIRFTISGFLKQLGRHTGGSQTEWLKRCFRRMTACSVELRSDGKTFGGSLITSYGWDDNTSEFFLVLDPRIAQLFNDDLYTRLHWPTRLKLDSNYTRWLHGYLCTHRTLAGSPHRVRLTTLELLSRSSFQRFRDFRRKVEESMRELEQHDVVSEWLIDSNDVLIVTRREKPALHNQKTTA